MFLRIETEQENYMQMIIILWHIKVLDVIAKMKNVMRVCLYMIQSIPIEHILKLLANRLIVVHVVMNQKGLELQNTKKKSLFFQIHYIL